MNSYVKSVILVATLCTGTDYSYSMKRVGKNKDLVTYFKKNSSVNLIEATRLVVRVFLSLKVKRASWEDTFDNIGFDKIISISKNCNSKKEALIALTEYKKDSSNLLLLESEIEAVLEILVNLAN